MLETKSNIGSEVRLRRLRVDDLPAAQALSAELRWPHRREDWALALRLGTGLAATDGDRVIGVALSWRFARSAAALGMIIVAKGRRGRGIGTRLLSDLTATLGQRQLVLHSTEAGQRLYLRAGFVSDGTVREHQGTTFAIGLAAPPAGLRLRPAGLPDRPALIALDAAANGVARAEALSALFDLGETVALDRNGEVIGFSLFRRFGQGFVIGPVVAPNAVLAQVLIAHWLGAGAGMFIRIDVPAESGLSPWLEEVGLSEAGTVLRMVRGRPWFLGAGVARFALASHSLG